MSNRHAIVTLIVVIVTACMFAGGTCYGLWQDHRERLLLAYTDSVLESAITVWPEADLQEDKPYSDGFDGIDISFYQGYIRWNELYADSLRPRFIYIRVMGRAARTDTLYHHNLRCAQRLGIPVGSYVFYSHFLSVQEQFDKFVSMASKEKQDLRPMLDVESLSLLPDSDNTHLRDSVLLFAKKLTAHYGKAPLIYSSQNFYRDYLAPTMNKYPLWLANYSREPVVKGTRPILWQRSESGHVHGIYTSVDLDCFINGGNMKHLRLK